MSSAQVERCGRKSDRSMPQSPYFLNVRGLPRMRAPSFWMKAKRTFLVIDSGSFWPFSSLSFGLGSKRSSLAGRAFEVDADARLRLRREVRRFRRQRIGRVGNGGQQTVLSEHRRQRQQTDAAGGRREELAARLKQVFVNGVHGDSPCLGFLQCHPNSNSRSVFPLNLRSSLHRAPRERHACLRQLRNQSVTFAATIGRAPKRETPY